MFKKAGDNVHYLARTGSHATKGSRRGVDSIVPLGDGDFYSEQNIRARRREIRSLKGSRRAHRTKMLDVIAAFKEAAKSGNGELRAAIHPVIKELDAKIKKLQAQIDELVAVTPKRIIGQHPNFAEMRVERKTKYLKKYPQWWNDASPRRRKKYVKWLTKQNYTGK